MMRFWSQSRLASPTPYRVNHIFTLKPPTDRRMPGHRLNITCASDLISIYPWHGNNSRRPKHNCELTPSVPRLI